MRCGLPTRAISDTIDEHLAAATTWNKYSARCRASGYRRDFGRQATSRYDSAILVLVFMMSSSQIYYSAGAPVSQTRESLSSVTGFLSNRIALRYDNAVAV